jgi:hypothetical protein
VTTRSAPGARETAILIARPYALALDTSAVDDDRPPICPVCGVTMVPAALSSRELPEGDWICLECEETAEPDAS